MVGNREAWEMVARRIGNTECQKFIAQAEADAATAVPTLPATLWLDFARTGHRAPYEAPASKRRRMLWNLTVAECLENTGRFLDPLLNVAWATCEESSWAYPAHESTLADIHHPYLDLGAAGTALMLAEMVTIMKSKLDPQLSKRVHDEIERRCIAPYLARDDHWWLFQSKGRNAANWTAVCNSGIVGAAIYIEADPQRLAAIIQRALRSLEDYIDSFAADGGTSEGPGYWGYGFGNYVILADLLFQRTGGKVDILAGDRLREIASFPLRTLLRHGVYVNFSDCDPDVALEPALLHYLGKRLDLPAFHGLAHSQPDKAPHRAYFDWGIRSLFWLASDTSSDFAPARHDWFESLQWLIARMDPADPNALVLAAKGGHNDEMHNQNDVGNFIVHWHGESLIADVGRGKYTKEYFGEERYTYFVNSSFGHSVPVVNGERQGTGEAFAAQILEAQFNDDQATLLLDLTAAYPATAARASMKRRLTLHRDPPHGWVSMEDRFLFAHVPTSFESVLTTFNQVKIGENEVLINGTRGDLRVGFDPEEVEARVEEHEVEFDYGMATVNRIVFAARKLRQEGVVRLEIIPR